MKKETWLWFAWIVGLGATLGSLYFSEIKHWEPCVLCWYQRIVVYPMSIILLIAAIHKDAKVARYVMPVLAVGVVISVYHYLLQWGIFQETCGINAVSCAYVPTKWFGFVTLPFLALVAELLMIFGLWQATKKSALKKE